MVEEVRSISATAAGAPTRTVALTMGTHMRVTAITDPDSGSVGFYYADNATARRMMGQRDRRGAWTWYGYDNTGKLVISTMILGSAPDPAADVTAYFGSAGSHGARRAMSAG